MSFPDNSSQNSTSPRRGALTTCTQELLPSGMLPTDNMKYTTTTYQLYVPCRISTLLTLCVTVKDQKGSTSSTGVNSPPRMMLPWRSGGRAQSGCSEGFLEATRCCGTVATSSDTTWSKMTTCSTCWVLSLLPAYIQYMYIHRFGFAYNNY